MVEEGRKNVEFGTFFGIPYHFSPVIALYFPSFPIRECLQLIFFFKVRVTQKETLRDHLAPSSHPQMAITSRAGPNPGARSFFLIFPQRCRGPRTWIILCFFHKPLAQSWIKSRIARTQTDTHTEWQWKTCRINPLCLTSPKHGHFRSILLLVETLFIYMPGPQV